MFLFKPSRSKIDSKHLFIHIGPRKTGTTAVQEALVHNDDLLAEQDYSCVLAANARNVDIAKSPKKLARNIASARHKKVILSYEGYLSDRRERLLQNLYGQFDDSRMTFVMYARRPDIRLECWCNYNMNRDSEFIDSHPDEFLHRKGLDINALRRGEAVDDTCCVTDYARLCDELAADFPQAEIIVRPYWERGQKDWDIFQDFCCTIGLKAPQVKARRANVTLSKEANAVLRTMRKRAGKTGCSFRHHIMYDLMRSHPEFQAAQTDDRSFHPLFTPEQRDRVLDLYRDSLRDLFARQGISREEFDEWYSVPLKHGSDKPAEVSEAEQALAEAFVDYVYMHGGCRTGLCRKIMKWMRSDEKPDPGSWS